jgi:hypothetical protein
MAVRNVSAEPFDTLSSFSLGGTVQLGLLRDGEWEHFKRNWDLILIPGGGYLAPGEQVCDVDDLLPNYGGTDLTLPQGDTTYTFHDALSPGNYTARAYFLAKVSQWSGVPGRYAVSNDLSFTVSSTSSIPQSEAGALTLLRVATDPARPRASVSQWQSIQLAERESRYLVALARWYLPASDSVDLLTLANECETRDGDALSGASLLRFRFIQFVRNGPACRAWLHRLALDESGRFDCYRRGWENFFAAARRAGWVKD